MPEDNNTIDELKIEIVGESKSAEEHIQSVTDKLKALSRQMSATDKKLAKLQETGAKGVRFDVNIKKASEKLSRIERRLGNLKNVKADLRFDIDKKGQSLPDLNDSIPSAKFEIDDSEMTALKTEAEETVSVLDRLNDQALGVRLNEELQTAETSTQKLHKSLLSTQGQLDRLLNADAGATVWTDFRDGAKMAFDEVKQRIAPAQQSLLDLKGRAKDVFADLKDSRAFRTLAYLGRSVASPIQAIGKLKAKFGEMKTAVMDAVNTNPKLAAGLKAVKTGAKIAGTAVKGFVLAGKGIKNLYGLIGKGLGKAFSGLGDRIKGAGRKFVGAFSRIGRVATYRAIRAGLKLVTDGFKEGVANADKFSNATGGTLSKSLDKIATSGLYLKNSLGALAAPLIDAVAPAIDWITDKFVDFMNTINQFLAAATGKKTWMQAVKYPAKFADSADDAASSAKELKATILGIDEINPLNGRNDGGSGGSSSGMDYNKMFKKEAITESFADLDWTALGNKLSDGITGALNKLTEKVNAFNWQGLGTKVGGFLNGIQWNSIFTSFGNLLGGLMHGALTAMFSFADTYDWAGQAKSASDGVKNFLNALREPLEKFDFNALGGKLAAGFNNINFGGILTEFASLISSGFSAVTETIEGFVKNTDWTKKVSEITGGIVNALVSFSNTVKNIDLGGIAKGVGDAINGIRWEEMLSGFGKLTGSLAGGILDAVNGLLTGTDFQSLSSGIVNGISGFFKKLDFQSLAGKIGLALKNGISATRDILQGLKDAIIKIDWKEVGLQLAASLVSMFENFDFGKSFENIWSIVKDALYITGTVLMGLGEALWESIKAVLRYARDKIVEKLGEDSWISKLLMKIPLDPVEKKGNDVGDKIVTGTTGSLNSEKNKKSVSDGYQNLTSGVKDKKTSISAAVVTTWPQLKPSWDPLMTNTKDKQAKIAAAVVTTWANLKVSWESIMSNVKDKTATLTAAAKDGIGKTLDGAKDLWTKITTRTSTLTAAAKSTVGNVLDGAKSLWDKLVTKTSTLTAAAKNSVGKTLDAPSSLWANLVTGTRTLTAAAKNNIGSILDSPSAFWTKLTTATRTLTASAVNKVGDILKNPDSLWGKLVSKTATLTAAGKNNVGENLKTPENLWGKLVNVTRTLTAAGKNEIGNKLDEAEKKWDSIKTETRTLTATGKVNLPNLKTVEDAGSSLTNSFRTGMNKNSVIRTASISKPTDADASSAGEALTKNYLDGMKKNSLSVRASVVSATADDAKAAGDKLTSNYKTGMNQNSLTAKASVSSITAQAAKDNGAALTKNYKTGMDSVSLTKTFSVVQPSSYKNPWEYGNSMATGVRGGWNDVTITKAVTVTQPSGYGSLESYGKDLGKRIRNGFNETFTGGGIKFDMSTIKGGSQIVVKASLMASGGFPDAGQLFVANEAGPEMVGTIGNRTAVANTQQIVAGIANGVYEGNREQNVTLQEIVSLLAEIAGNQKRGTQTGADGSLTDAARINQRAGKVVA